MSANVQMFTEIFCEGSDVRARRTRDPRVEVEGTIEIVFDELAVRSDGGELVDAYVYGLTLDVLTTTRKFVELSSLNFFCRIHWRHLIDITAKTFKCCFDLFLSPVSWF